MAHEPTSPPPPAKPPAGRVDVVHITPTGDADRREAALALQRPLPATETPEIRRLRLAHARVQDVEQEARRFEQALQPVPAATRSQLLEAREEARAAQLAIEGSQQIDPWEYAYRQSWAIQPTVDPLLATRAAMSSDGLSACIEAMSRGVGGHGYELVPRIGAEAMKLVAAETAKEIEIERLQIERWFTYCNSDIPFVEIRARSTAMQETCGYAAWEFLPDESGRLVGIDPMPSYSVRISPQADMVLAPVPVQQDDGSWGVNLQWKPFRRVIQIINGRIRWFKQFGDPRFLDGSTGQFLGRPDELQRVIAGATEDEKAVAREYLRTTATRAARQEARAILGDIDATPEAREDATRCLALPIASVEQHAQALRVLSADTVAAPDRQRAEALLAEMKRIRDEGNEAHEVMIFSHFGVFGGTTPYGGPRWYGATYSVLGRQKAAIANMSYWDNNAIPRLAVLVQGTLLGEEEVDRIRDYFKGIKGAENQNDVLVIQAAPGGGGASNAFDEQRGQIRLTLQPLTEALHKDGIWLEYAREALKDIRRAFGLPPALTGDSDDYSRAAVDTARLIAEETVFQPIRTGEDHQINHKLLPRLGFKHWLFKTRGAHISDETATVALLTLMDKGAGLSTEELRRIGSAKLGQPLPAIGKDWALRPSALNGAMATFLIDPASGQSIQVQPGAAAVTQPESPDATPAEVDGDQAAAAGDADDTGAAAEAAAGEAEAASASGDAAADAATPKQAPRLWLANVDPAAVRTAEDVVAIYEAFRREVERRNQEERDGKAA